MSTLAPVLAQALAASTGLPASLAPEVYTGPPSGPAVWVRPVGPERASRSDGTISGSVSVAVYGGSLDLAPLVLTGDGYVRPERREHDAGTLVRVQRGTITETVLPSGLAVESATLAVTGYASHPVLAPEAVQQSEADAVLGAVAREVADRLRTFGKVLARVDVDSATLAHKPGMATVTGTIRVVPVNGTQLGALDIDGLASTALAAVEGTASGMGRITTARLVSAEPKHDGRAPFAALAVELITAYDPA